MTYFDREARNYSARSQKGIWKYVRHLERNAVLKELDPKPGEKILDVGCGVGFYSSELKRAGAEVIGIDCSLKMLEEFRTLGLQGLHGNFESYNFDTRFDKVLIAGAAEFMNDSFSLIRQIERILLPHGCAVILAPRVNLIGHIYKTWHAGHGVTVSLRDYQQIFQMSPNLVVRSFKNITAMSYLLRVEHL